MNNRLLIIPVEIKARELTAKLLLGALAVTRGYSVVIGRGGEVASFARYLRPGIFLEKDIAVGRKVQFQTLTDRGHALVAWDDEGIVEINYDLYIKYRIDRDNLSSICAFFAWGAEQANVIRRHFPDMSSKVIETGNPRIDLLRPIFRILWENESESYREKFGEYILINSNFGGVNIFNKESENYIELITKRLSLNAKEAATFRSTLHFSGLLFTEFKQVIPVLAKRFPDKQIIIRPHPSEHHDTWREISAGLPNVHVLYIGTAVGWIAGARVLVHNGCTTGLEGVIMDGVPVIAYRPHLSDEYDLELPNDVSIQAFSEVELIEKIEGAFDKKRVISDVDAPRRMLDAHIASLKGPLASDKILDCIDSIEPESGRRRFFQYPAVYRIKRIYIRMFFFFYNFFNRLKHGNRDAFRPHLFRVEDIAEMKQLLELLALADPRIKGVTVERIFPFCYRLVKHNSH